MHAKLQKGHFLKVGELVVVGGGGKGGCSCGMAVLSKWMLMLRLMLKVLVCYKSQN
jgi:hypothetical protein